MSGFVGIVNFDGEPVDEELLRRLLARLAYLGPDASGMRVDGAAGFVHTLFRTTHEATSGQQPLTVDELTIVADARIDAREELVRALRGAGYATSLDEPDVNLILTAYRAWGEECAQHLIGDFAFMIWDKPRRKVYCAGDHFGICPLYYARVGSTLMVANEIGAIRLHPKVSPALNERNIGDFLVCGSQIWVDKSSTAFADIHRIPPAHQLCADAETVTVKPYWTLSATSTMLRYRTEEEYVTHFMQVFAAAIKDRLRTDRAVISMSGGLDSPAIVAVASQLVQSGEVDCELTAYTMVYDRIHPDNEAYYASLAARKIGIPHHISSVDRFLLQDTLPNISEPRFILQNGLYEATQREKRTFGNVSLHGYGADELFLPTPLYQVLISQGARNGVSLFFWLWRFLGHRPSLGGVRQALNPLRRRAGAREIPFDFPTWLNPDFEQRLDLRGRWNEYWNWEPAETHSLHPTAYLSVLFPTRTARSELLHPPDFTPVEGTDPFLDLRVVDFVMSLPPQPWFNRKYLLRRAMRDLLPPEVVNRPKTILGWLLTSLLQQPDTEWIDEWEATSDLDAYVNRAAIPRIAGNPSEYRAALVNLRPMFLNQWLLQRNDIYDC